MSSIACVYCGKYWKKMLGNKCYNCLNELTEIINRLNNKPKNNYDDNILQFKVIKK